MSITSANTTKGKISGIGFEGYTVFKGIRYAKAAEGELRFKAPVETEPWEGVYEAYNFGNMCAQSYRIPGSFYQKEFYDEPAYLPGYSEDSLFLNIWTPAQSEEERLPVAFYIPGGAFRNGFSQEKEFDGAAYCRKGVILVTINYRLGLFGFLAHPWLTKEDEHGSAGNYGILDQIAALKWVYENIEAFGGDRNRITIMGQSAGSMSAQVLVSSELTGNMISKAIFQSGAGYRNGISERIDLDTALSLGEEYVKVLNVNSLEELRALPAETIIAGVPQFEQISAARGLKMGLYPVIDGYVLKDDYDDLTDKGQIKDIPYMLGSNKDDIYVTKEMLENGDKGGLYKGCLDFSFKLEGLGRKPAYVYYFTRELLGDTAGAFHSAELWYMFGTLNRSWRPKEAHDYELSREMIDCWTNFIKTGNPNNPDGGSFRPCAKTDPYIKEFA